MLFETDIIGIPDLIFLIWLQQVQERYRSHSPYCDVEDVTAHWTRHGHVPQTFPGHDHTGDQVRDGRPSCQYGQTHYFLRDAHSLTHLWTKIKTGVSSTEDVLLATVLQ